MYTIYYEMANMFPYSYVASLVWSDKEHKVLVERMIFKTWYDLEQYAKSHNAELKFDGII